MELLENETTALTPQVLPAGWQMRTDTVNGIVNPSNGYSAIWSVERFDTPDRWVHVSYAIPGRLPTYAELKMVKAWFMPDLKAIQIFAPTKEHVNHHATCLHLWANLDRELFPDFRREGSL